jgi:ABC-type transport system involved in cytochrome bd biosynthesis fused ATPase/permease subunit
MGFRRLFKNRKKPDEEGKPESPIDQGLFYVYLIIGMQVLLVFGILAVIMVVGKVMATPMWVFVLAVILAVGGFVHIMRKARQQLQKLRSALQRMNLGNRNYEISFMGGVMTMRVEQNTRPLLDAPTCPVADDQTIDTPSSH